MLSNQPSDVLAYLFCFLDTKLVVTLRSVSKLFLLTVSNKCIPLHFNISSLEHGLILISMFKKVTFEIGYSNSFDDSGLEKLAKHITSLVLFSNRKISNLGLRHLINLTYLDVRHNNIITDEGIQHLVNLTELHVYGNNTITNKCYRSLMKLKILAITRRR